MLRTRVITALVLLAVLLPVLFAGSPPIVIALCALFFGAACWESLRLFGQGLPIPAAIIWAGIFIWLAHTGVSTQFMLVWSIGLLAWLLRFLPSLKFGLPALASGANRIASTLYLLSVLGCFLAIVVLQRHSPVYLLSVLAIVWVADIGAYFFGKAFGKRKLAPTISPGKSWEGALGGWMSVLVVAGCSTMVPFLADSFSSTVQARWGWIGLGLVLTGLAAASVVGDLVESQLKRRVQVKDSSSLLPGHGGVLDRIDALIPALPLAVLVQTAMELGSRS